MDENKKYCGKCGNILGDNGYCVRCGYNNNPNMYNEIIAEEEKIKYKKPSIGSTILLIINVLGAVWIVPIYTISLLVFIFVGPLTNNENLGVSIGALALSLVCSIFSLFSAINNYQKKGEKTASIIIITIIAYILIHVLGKFIW